MVVASTKASHLSRVASGILNLGRASTSLYSLSISTLTIQNHSSRETISSITSEATGPESRPKPKHWYRRECSSSGSVVINFLLDVLVGNLFQARQALNLFT